MSLDGRQTQARTLSGIAHALAGFSVFSAQDAIVKWLVAKLPVFEILFFRSIVILALATAILGPRRVPGFLGGQDRAALLLRSALILAAWLAYFTAAKSLHLAELVTIYFSAPIFVVILSVIVLRESVGPMRWIATILGFVGVVIAADPTGTPAILPVLLTVFAAFAWACTNILIRSMSATVSTLTLMIAGNAVFVVVCGATMPFIFVTPDLFSLGLMIGLGLVGGIGQYLLFEGYRLAPASAVAPFEYITLIWAFVWGYLIWHDWPNASVFQGAALILISGVGLIAVESAAGRRSLK